MAPGLGRPSPSSAANWCVTYVTDSSKQKSVISCFGRIRSQGAELLKEMRALPLGRLLSVAILATMLMPATLLHGYCVSVQSSQAGSCMPHRQGSHDVPCSLHDCCHNWTIEPTLAGGPDHSTLPITNLIRPRTARWTLELAAVQRTTSLSPSPPGEFLIQIRPLRI